MNVQPPPPQASGEIGRQIARRIIDAYDRDRNGSIEVLERTRVVSTIMAPGIFDPRPHAFTTTATTPLFEIIAGSHGVIGFELLKGYVDSGKMHFPEIFTTVAGLVRRTDPSPPYHPTPAPSPFPGWGAW